MTTIQTILARDIDTENIDIRYDRSVKRVLANTPLLAPITKYTVKELKNYSIPMVEKCIDADSIQVSQIFVEPGLTNRKILNDELESKIPGEGRAIFDIRFTITPCLTAARAKSSSTSKPSRKAIPATAS